MGKHFWGGIGLLCLLLAATVWIGFCMEQSNRSVRQILTEAQQTAGKQLDKATELVQEAKERWDRSEGWVSALADHTPMDQIRELFAEAELFGQGGESTHFATVCARLISLLQDMADAHKLTLRNLF